MNRFRLFLLLAVMLLAACGGDGLTDIDLGPSVQGVVTDAQSGAPLGDVRIEVSGRMTLTNPNGTFLLFDVRNGEQTLTASKAGYQTYVQTVTVGGATFPNHQVRMQRSTN